MPKSSFKLITPELATEYLERNKNNRDLRERLVDTYAQDMRNGHWLENNQGVALDVNGNLLDGQHRLAAIVRSGVPVRVLVVSDLPVHSANGVKLRTVDTIDVGKPRGLGDLLALGHGVDNANMVVAVTRIIVELINSFQGRKLTMPMLLQVLRVYRPAIQGVMDSRQWVRGLTNAPVLGALSFAAKACPEDTVTFTKRLFSGEDLRAGSPILHVRNFLLSGKVNYKKGPRNRVIARAVLSALMHYIEGRAVTARLHHTDAAVEYFADQQEVAIGKVKAIFSLGEETA